MDGTSASLTGALTGLSAGQRIPYGGDRWTEVSAELAAAFRPGDRIVVVQTTGDIIHVSASVTRLTDEAVSRAVGGFAALSRVPGEQITAFYEAFAQGLADDEVFSQISAANALDVADARRRDRATNRLNLDGKMRASMIEALRMWRDLPDARDVQAHTVDHGSWSVAEVRAPLGVIGFVFEGRPNVFADATGVLRSGNTAVFRIGSDALGTARSMMVHAVEPALERSGLPRGSVVLLDSPERSAGHALFSHPKIALAVARGSGPAVAQLGAVARQSGIPASLHGTGGAWMIVSPSAPADRVAGCVEASLDRKVCNTVNVICLPRRDAVLLAAVVNGLDRAAQRLSERALVHVVGSESDERDVRDAVGVRDVDIARASNDDVLAREWEWDGRPEVSLRFVDDLYESIELFNRHSPQFILSILSDDSTEVDEAYQRANAPFVGDGFTRWVDGQYALLRPELGLSNWQDGRLFARGGILSGDGVFSVRYRSTHTSADQRR